MSEYKLLSLIIIKAEIAQLVEHQFPKLKAAGSNPVFRSKIPYPPKLPDVQDNP